MLCTETFSWCRQELLQPNAFVRSSDFTTCRFTLETTWFIAAALKQLRKWQEIHHQSWRLPGRWLEVFQLLCNTKSVWSQRQGSKRGSKRENSEENDPQVSGLPSLTAVKAQIYSSSASCWTEAVNPQRGLRFQLTTERGRCCFSFTEKRLSVGSPFEEFAGKMWWLSGADVVRAVINGGMWLMICFVFPQSPDPRADESLRGRANSRGSISDHKLIIKTLLMSLPALFFGNFRVWQFSNKQLTDFLSVLLIRDHDITLTTFSFCYFYTFVFLLCNKCLTQKSDVHIWLIEVTFTKVVLNLGIFITSTLSTTF